MSRKKKISKKNIKDKNKKEIKVLNIKKSKLIKENFFENNLEEIINKSIDVPNVATFSLPKIREKIPTDSLLEINIPDNSKKNTDNNEFYSSINTDYTSRDKYQTIKNFYSELTLKEIIPQSFKQNFDSLNFENKGQNSIFKNTESSTYPNTEEKKEKKFQYEPFKEKTKDYISRTI
ncbi:MAG: hypothetical protein QXW97_01080 [Candidatus Pacearchaeota archaeon]